MKRTAVVVAVAVAVLIALLIIRQCGGNDLKSSSGSLPRGVSTRATIGAASQHVDNVPPWLAQFGVKARRIAGKVVFLGNPVPDAVVHLALDAGHNVLQQLAEVRTGADGTFNFGPWPAAWFNVSAEAPGRKPVQLIVALADQRTKPDQLVLELGECRSRLYGSVLDASGGVVPKAKIRVAGLAGGESDANGQYNVCVEPTNQFVRVEADGYGTIAVVVGLTGELRYDFTLVPEAIVVGQVLTEDTKPVSGARVIALPDPGELPHYIASGWAISADDGRFRIPGLSPGHYRLLAAADGFTTKSPVDTIVQAGTATRDAIVVVSATARLKGHVVMADRPIAGATVTAIVGVTGPQLPGQDVSLSVKSQEDGSFVLQGVPRGKIGISAFPYQVLSPRLLAVETASVDNIKVEVAALASIHGTITRKGQPVTDGIVQGPQMDPVNADRNGEYRVEGVQPGEIQLVALSSESKAFALPKPVQVAAGEDKLFDIELDFAGRVKGVVVDENGKGVPGVYVRMFNGDGDMGESMTTTNGEFDAGSMSGGDYRASVYPSPMAGQPFELVAGDEMIVKVPKDGVVSGVKIAIKYETFTISGTIVDNAGRFVPDVHIEAIGRGKGGIGLPSLMSTADGTFRIKNLARGTYNLHAHAFDGSEGDAFDIAAGAENVTVKLMGAGTLEGTLVGFSTTPAIVVHTLTPDLSVGGWPIVEGTHFRQTGLRPGKYSIEAKAGAETDGVSAEIKSGETTTVTLTSRGMAEIEGNLYEFGTKTPLPGYRCDSTLSMAGQMGGPPEDQSQMAFPDKMGYFTMAAPTGMVRVFCFPQSTSGVTSAGTDVEVRKNARARVEIYGVRMKSASPSNAGIRIKPLTLPLVINAVEPNSVAAKRGIKVGDRVVTIDGASVQGLLPIGAMTLIGNHTPGSTVSIGIERGGTVTAYELPVVVSSD